MEYAISWSPPAPVPADPSNPANSTTVTPFQSLVEPMATTTTIAMILREMWLRRIFLLQHAIYTERGIDVTSASLNELASLREQCLEQATRRRSVFTARKNSSAHVQTIVAESLSPNDEKQLSKKETSAHVKLEDLPNYDFESGKKHQQESLSAIAPRPMTTRIYPEVQSEMAMSKLSLHQSMYNSIIGEEDATNVLDYKTSHYDIKQKRSTFRLLLRALNKLESKIYIFPKPNVESAFHSWRRDLVINTFRTAIFLISLSTIMHTYIDIATYCQQTDNLAPSATLCGTIGLNVSHYRVACAALIVLSN
ncbi:hypothetical protein HDU76_008608 [Blyttiomyces sp. JEL0837]|nr:hypothetical protein HDU76_008608 [Blyttiomyces sp. JEL0837]